MSKLKLSKNAKIGLAIGGAAAVGIGAIFMSRKAEGGTGTGKGGAGEVSITVSRRYKDPSGGGVYYRIPYDVSINMVGVAKTGVPAPDMVMEILIYRPPYTTVESFGAGEVYGGGFESFDEVVYPAVELNTPMTLDKTYTPEMLSAFSFKRVGETFVATGNGYGEFRIKGKMVIENIAGREEIPTSEITFKLGEAPSGTLGVITPT